MRVALLGPRRSHLAPCLSVCLFFLAALCGAPAAAANYVTRIDTQEVFESVTIPEGFRDDLLRTGKYLAPADADPDLLPTVFQDVHVYPRHIEFMAGEFPERFPSLTPEEYQALVEVRATRRYWAGSLYGILPREGDCQYGFTVFTARDEASELPTREEVESIVARLSESFTLGDLCYVPESGAAESAAREWIDPPFSIYFLQPDTDVVYEAYTSGTTYGHVRLLRAADAERLSASGSLRWQDLLVIDGVPAFLESVVAGIVTGARQGELSHLNVRAARRGTPNVFVRDAHDAFRAFDGELVRVAFGVGSYEPPVIVEEAEAEAWWAEHRPRLDPPAPVDLDWTDLSAMRDAVDSREVLVSRFGGKATNLALLNGCLPEEMRLAAFAIPFHWYEDFIDTNRVLDYRQVPPRFVTLKEYITWTLEEPSFRSDPERRALWLEELRRVMEDGTLNSDLVAALRERIREVFGSADVMVRFRSSSNMEDNLEFNGAGLYDSTSVCALDSEDGDDDGPSQCDPDQDSERTIQRGLRRVWSSLWNARAYEEREYYQLPQEQARMAILVTPAYPDEAANGVAFTGNPVNPQDKRYLINAQLGDVSVVTPEDPSIVPERDLLEITGGEVTGIIRARASSLVPPGSFVLSDEQLSTLGSVLYSVEESFPIDYGPFDPEWVLLDFEFKFTQAGDLVLKQVRPFLIAEVAGAGPTFHLVITEDTAFEGVHLFDRRLDDEQRLLSAGRFRAGTFPLATTGAHSSAELIDDLRIGGRDREAQAQGPGDLTFTVRGDLAAPTYTFTYIQRFEVEGRVYELAIRNLSFKDEEGSREIIFDDDYLSRTGIFLGGLNMTAVPVDDPENAFERVIFGGAGYRGLPLYRADLEGGGDRIELDYRLLRVLEPTATGPANLVRARVEIQEGVQEVTDYWRLVYRAGFHNILQRFRILLDPPLGDAHAVEVHEPFPQGSIPARGFVLGSDLEILRTLTIDRYEERLLEDPREALFVRGDANADGRTNISDALAILFYLFLGRTSLPCRDALDVDDTSAIDLADAIHLLTYLFSAGAPPAEPFAACGTDATPDDGIPCVSFDPCGAR
ncbi:MAG: hypothetical protein JXA90_10800 [Planctomycetes bacterium]|nr:hypothetical protein [Planctomycetota bacterium]